MSNLNGRTLRRTGRTHRMLCDAIEAARAGQDVVVLCASVMSMRDLCRRACDMLGDDCSRKVTQYNAEIVIHGHSVRFMLAGDRNIDLRFGELRGSDARLFADHFAIEVEMGWALSEWAKYSAPDLLEDK